MTQDVMVTMAMTLPPEAAAGFAKLDPAGLAATRQFPGCLGVRIVMHKDDPTRFLFIERWETEQAYHDYIAWRSERGEFQALESMALSIAIDVWPHTIVDV